MAFRHAVRYNLGFLLFIVAVMSVSGYFTYRVEEMRGRGAKARITESIAANTEVTVVDVIDGDELVARAAGGENFVVRILGIKSFDPVANDPHTGVFGHSAFVYLDSTVKGQSAQLEFDSFQKDKRGRVLAYVNHGGVDVGKELVTRGLSLAYVKYPFAREPAYRLAQAEARDAQAGLWGSPRAVQRAEALVQTWEAVRSPTP